MPDSKLKTFYEWQRYTRDTEPKLPAGYTVDKLRWICWVIASYNPCGINCYPTNETLCKATGWSRVHTVIKYKKLAVELGWLIDRGRTSSRVVIYDINIPVAEPFSNQDAFSPVNEASTESDPWDS